MGRRNRDSFFPTFGTQDPDPITETVNADHVRVLPSFLRAVDIARGPDINSKQGYDNDHDK